MNACKKWKNKILESCLIDTSPPDLRRHLERCDACASALAEMRVRQTEIDSSLKHLVGGTEPSTGFRTRVLAAAESQTGWRGWPWAWAGAVAATLVLTLATFLTDKTPPRQDPALTAAEEMSRWQAPTDVLLRSPVDPLLRSNPRVSDVYFSVIPQRPRLRTVQDEGRK